MKWADYKVHLKKFEHGSRLIEFYFGWVRVDLTYVPHYHYIITGTF